MSCTGQSAAAHSVSTPSANHIIWRRVTIGEPSRTTFGPMTRTAYTAKPTSEATSTQTSGCAWYFQGSTAAAIDAVISSGEQVEGGEHDEVHRRGQDDA